MLRLFSRKVAQCKGIWIPRSHRNFFLWNSESWKNLLWNPESWALESGIQLKESGIPLTIGIRNPSFTDKESGFQYLESGIRDEESRIQDMSWIPLHRAKGLLKKTV